MKMKKFLAMLLAGVLTCGVAVPVFADDVETLTMLTYVDWYGDGLKAVENYIHDNAETLGFDLEIQQIPGGGEGDELVAARTATNDLPDILNTYTVFRYFNGYGGEGKLVPLDDLESIAEYDPAIFEGNQYVDDGVIYGLPLGTAYYYGTYYNKNVMEEAGIESFPTNWDEFLEACEKIKETGKIPVYFSGADTWTLQIFFETGFVKDIVESGKTRQEFWDAVNSNQIKFADCEHALDVCKRTKDLIEMGYVQETYLSDSYDMAQTALANGECGFYICANTVVSEIGSKYPDKLNDIGGNLIPLFEEEINKMGMAYPTMVSVTTASENPELAKKAVDFLCSAQAQEIYAQAQQGVYLNKEMSMDSVAPALAEQSECPTIAPPDLKYEASAIATNMVDYYIGAKELEEIGTSLDDTYARSAEAAGDEFWTE